MAHGETYRSVLSGAGTPLNRTSVSTDVDSDWKLLLSPEGQETGPHVFWEGDTIGPWLRVCIYFSWSRARRHTDRSSNKLFSIRYPSRSEALQRLVCCPTHGEEAYLSDAFRYGLGTCYLRMNKVRMAEYHYRKAAEIHPTNAILIGCIGLVSFFFCFCFPLFFTLHKTKERVGDNEIAIQLYGKAIEYCPENALVRYRRGKLLIGMKRYKVGCFCF